MATDWHQGYGGFEWDRRQAITTQQKKKDAEVVRDLFGNPFRPVPLDASWLTAIVVSLAESVYAGRSFEGMPILGDALEEAGCTNADILGHCRGPGPHVRGCWVVDLLLGKE